MDGSILIFIMALITRICLRTGVAPALTAGRRSPRLTRDADQPARTKLPPKPDHASSDPGRIQTLLLAGSR